MTLEQLAVAQTAFVEACEAALAEFKSTCPDVSIEDIVHGMNQHHADPMQPYEPKFGCRVVCTIDGASITRTI